MKTNIITLMTLIITITGCGGGGGGGAEESKSPPTEAVTKKTTTTSDLNSAPDFNFISSADLDITLPASPSENISYFINICTDFSTKNDEVTINYDSCKLRTSLTTVEQPFILSLSVVELALVAQIWPLEDGAEPITVYWNITESGNSWRIAI